MLTTTKMFQSTAATMRIKNGTGTKLASSEIEKIFQNNQVDKHIKLEIMIRYLEQIKNQPVELYMKEARRLLSQVMLEFKADNEHFLPLVKFLDIAHVHKTNKVSDEEQGAFKRRIEEIVTELIVEYKEANGIDWRIARKILSLNNHFSLKNIDLKQIEEGILESFKAEIEIALDHLLWPKYSLFVDSAKTNLISLRQCFDSPVDKDQRDLLEAVLCGRFDKEKFKLSNSLVLGEDGGLYLLLNRMNQQQQDALITDQIVSKEYLKDKIKAKDEGPGKGDKVVLETGGFGKVRFALSLLRSRSPPAEIVCVKKTKCFQELGGSFKPTPLEQVTESTLGDYFTNDKAQAIYSPCILDMALITSKSVIKDDEKDHRKGYLMMEILPQPTATKIFADQRYQKWEHQKPYLLGVLETTQKLLECGIAMTDLKPDNTLYDVDTRKATILDLGGRIRVASSEELLKFDLRKYSYQHTPGFEAPELEGGQEVVNMHKVLAYSCGKVIETITRKSDYDRGAISQITSKLTALESQERISIPEAINQIKLMGNDSHIVFSHYISKVKDRIENKKSAISINEDIDKTEELLIALKSTSSDPSKFKGLKTEDLFQKIDSFLSSANTKQVMAIFGVAGSGKSIALQLKFIQAVYAWQPGQPLPIYFDLANGLDLDHVVCTLNAELGTNLSLKGLEGPHLYIDSFDEGLGIELKKETLIKEYFGQLQDSSKIVITCRTEYLHDNSYDWFSPESKELDVCYVAPINYSGQIDLPKMIDKYVCYSKQRNLTQHTTEDYLNRLKELQLTDLINTGFMFLMIMEVLFHLQNQNERRVNKADIYEKYITYYQNSKINQIKNQGQRPRLAEMGLLWNNNPQLGLCSLATELGQYLACQMHVQGQSRLDNSDNLFAALGYDNSVSLKHQSIIHMLKLLPLKIMTTHSGKRVISNQEVKIGFIHETIKKYYLIKAIESEVEKEGKSMILASKNIVHDSELVKLIVFVMRNNPQLKDSFLKAIETSKNDKSTTSITHASNSISLLVAAKHAFSGYDLRNIAVKGANIVNGIFEHAKLDGADLSGVDMSNLNIKGASLNGADMREAKFSNMPDLIGPVPYVTSVSFSPDGKFLASGSQTRTIKIWSPSTGQCLQTLSGHTGSVCSVSFSPDGKFVASGSDDKTIKIWNLSNGQCLQTLNGHAESVRSVSFSPDGKFLASVGSRDKMIKIWDRNTGECVQTLNGHRDTVMSVSFSPDGKFLASGSYDCTIKIWDPSTGEDLQTLNGHTSSIYSVIFSHDGEFLACGGSYNIIKIWNPNTGKCMQTLYGHTGSVLSLSFSPDGKFLASGSGSDDKTIKIWNPSTGECLQTLDGHTNSVHCLSFSPDGKFLVSSGSEDQTIKIWNRSTSDCLQTLDGHTDIILSVSFSPDGKFLASSGLSNTTIKIWNPSTGECLQNLKGHASHVWSVSFSPDGKFVASGSHDKTIKIWNQSAGECLQTLYGHTSYIRSVSFSPDGKFLASGSENKTIKIWNSTTGKCLQTLNGHTESVNSLSFSPDGKFLASGSDDKTIKIWSPITGNIQKPSTSKIWKPCMSKRPPLQTLKGHTSHVWSVSFSPDGKFVASGSYDKTIKIWDRSTRECVQTLNGHTDAVWSVSFSPDGKFLASGSGKEDKTIKIWDPNTGKCLQTLNGHTHSVSSLSFSADGKFLASGSNDKTIKIFEFETIMNTWLLKHNITSTLSPLVADTAILNKISQNNRLILADKGADTKPSITDTTSSQTKHPRGTLPESNRTANQLSQALLEKFVAHPQNKNSKLVTLSVNPHQSTLMKNI